MLDETISRPRIRIIDAKGVHETEFLKAGWAAGIEMDAILTSKANVRVIPIYVDIREIELYSTLSY